jgi:NADPH:quinone reductase-like Zn-dependent oxidoreductase
MKAIVNSSAGAGIADVIDPRPAVGEALVAVRAFSINRGELALLAARTNDWRPGQDIAGVVVEQAADGSGPPPGTRVVALAEQAGWSELAAVPTARLSALPDEVSIEQAAALPLAGLTAWQALIETARLSAGQRVLIHAAAGGVGHLAIQIAKAQGAHVTGTASADHHDLLRDLGADELIDYRDTDFAAAVTGADLVLETVGGAYPARSLRTLRDGGALISLRPFPAEVATEAAQRGIRAQVLLVEADHGGMTALAELAAGGKLRPVIAGTFPLAGAAKAHELGETGHVAGKLVLIMR